MQSCRPCLKDEKYCGRFYFCSGKDFMLLDYPKTHNGIYGVSRGNKEKRSYISCPCYNVALAYCCYIGELVHCMYLTVLHCYTIHITPPPGFSAFMPTVSWRTCHGVLTRCGARVTHCFSNFFAGLSLIWFTCLFFKEEESLYLWNFLTVHLPFETTKWKFN